MMNRKSPVLLFSVLLLVAMFTGCTVIEQKPDETLETDSYKVKKPAIKMTTVYFYRPDQSVSGWTWKDIDIMEIHTLGLVTDPDEEAQVTHVGTLKNNSVIKKQFTPGQHRFTANWELLPYEFTLKAGEEMCIKAEIGLINALQRRATFKIVDKDICESEIKNITQPKNTQWRIKRNSSDTED